MKLEPQKLRLFVVAMDGSASKVNWKSEFSDSMLAPCDLYERALDIEGVDHLPLSFRRDEDGTYIAAIYQKNANPGLLEQVLYMVFDLTDEQKYCLEDFSIFVRRSHARMKTVQVKSFRRVSKVRIWRSFRKSAGWENLNAIEMDVLDALEADAISF